MTKTSHLSHAIACPLAFATTLILNTKIIVMIRIMIRKVLNIKTIIIIKMIKRKLSALIEFI